MVIRLTKIIYFQTWQIGCYTRAIDTYTAFLLWIFHCQKNIQKLCLISFSLIRFKSLLIHAVIQLLNLLTEIFTHFFLAGLNKVNISSILEEQVHDKHGKMKWWNNEEIFIWTTEIVPKTPPIHLYIRIASIKKQSPFASNEEEFSEFFTSSYIFSRPLCLFFSDKWP